MEQNRGGITSLKCAQLAEKIVASAAPLPREETGVERKPVRGDLECARPLKEIGSVQGP